MKVHSITQLYLAFICLFLMSFIQTGIQPVLPQTILQKSPAEKGLFDSDEVLQITLKGNLRDLLNDRSSTPKAFPVVLSYNKEDNTEISIPVEINTRGHFRKLKENCFYPPLSIHFSKEGVQLTSVFKEQSKLKLVMPCKSDEFVIKEWMVYKIYNLVTDKSFRARLVKVTLDDERKKNPVSFYGILLEEEKQMAKRNKMVAVDKKIQPEQTQTDEFLTMSVFQYLIGNTDWSIQYLQNIKLLAQDSNAVPFAVPYDFDHAGIVSTPYAMPAEELRMNSVRERRYRGYCLKNLDVFETVIARYNSLKDEIYNLYTNNTLLDAKYIKSTVSYLDDFYKTINNPKLWQKDFAYPCDKNGTGNVVIKGLKQD